ncbi:MAG TPA: RQC domain-containing protein, partial [Thermoanaerobaculia bacterium]|nr:RQC domain-containing protein [Thermoanaerobaculia bacterium]
DRYCSGSVCRHRALSEYFGQQLEAEHCGACDLCLGDTEEVKDALVVAQKILSCVYRVGQSFGVAHVVSVLRGEDTERIRERNHNQLSTYGILKGHAKNDLRDWIYQLVSQGFLAQSGDQYPVLRLTETSRTLMRGEAVVRLRQPVAAPADAAGKMPAAESWEGVDRDLFEELRQWRRRQAEGRGVPPYVIFGDRALREMARLRPTNLTTLRGVYGVGDSKLSEHGQKLIEVISAFCKLHGLTTDLAGGQQASVAPAGSGGLRLRASIASASALFKRGASIDEAMRETGRSRGTVVGYLCAFIDETLPASVAPWVADSVYERVAIAADELGPSLLRPLRERLGEDVSYDEIRIVLAHLKTR